MAVCRVKHSAHTGKAGIVSPCGGEVVAQCRLFQRTISIMEPAAHPVKKKSEEIKVKCAPSRQHCKRLSFSFYI
jgi:hypothetical protein